MNGFRIELTSQHKIAKYRLNNKTMSSTYDIAIRASEEMIDIGYQLNRTLGQSDMLVAQIKETHLEVARLSDTMNTIEQGGEIDEFSRTQMKRDLESLRYRVERLNLLMDCAYATMDVVCIRNAEVSKMLIDL